jgi:AsmA protein
MTTGKKIALGVLVFLVVVVVGLAIAIPFLFDIDRYRPRVAAHIEEVTGKPAAIGKLTLTFFPKLSIRVDDFVLGNPSGFPKGDFLKTRRIYAEVDGGALWDREVVIQSIELNDPVINLLSNHRGKWNFENPPAPKATKKADDDPSAFTLGVISKVALSGGQLSAANVLSRGRKGATYFQARDVSIDLEDVDLNAFIASSSAALAPPASPLDSLFAGLGTTLAYAAPDAKPAAQGDLRAKSLRFGHMQLTGVRTKLRLFPQRIHFDDLNFGLYGGHASGGLSFNFGGRRPRYSTQARMSGVNVARLLEAFPDGKGMMTGALEGNIQLSGVILNSPDPLAGMRGTGQMSIHDGELPSLQLNKRLMTVARLTNLGPAEGDPSSFKSISADLNIANQRISSEKVSLVGNGVDVDGTGSVALAGAGNLAYEGVANVLAGENPVTNILTGLSGATFADGKLTFPFTLTGTLENPKFKMKTGSGAQRARGIQQLLVGGQDATAQEGETQQQQTPEDLVKGITGLFKRKKTTDQTQEQPQQ